MKKNSSLTTQSNCAHEIVITYSIDGHDWHCLWCNYELDDENKLPNRRYIDLEYLESPEMEIRKIPFCESCGIEIQSRAELGSEKDNSHNAFYCSHCYKHGLFTEPNVSFEEMVNRAVGRMSIQNENTKNITRKIMGKYLRWESMGAVLS